MTRGLVPALLALAAGGALAEDRPLARNLYGNTGVIDLPSAAMQPDGEIGFTLSHAAEATRAAVTFQALPWVEGTFRYASVDALAGETLYDRAFDIKFRLVEETGWTPALAVGFRDVLGTGIYASEYVVATKRLLPGLSASAGLGWGRLGSFGAFGRPFGGPEDRSATPRTDGDVDPSDYFKGEAAGFAGLVWETPVEGLTLKAEYSSDAYLPEEASGFERESPFNFGLDYTIAPGVTLGAQYLYGSEFGVSLSVSANPGRPGIMDENEPAPFPLGRRNPAWRELPVAEREAWAGDAEDRAFVLDRLRKGAEEEGIGVEAVALGARRADVQIVNTRFVTDAQAIGRMARIMARAMPATVETFDITVVAAGTPTTTVSLSRDRLEAEADHPSGDLTLLPDGVADAAPRGRATLEPGRYPGLIWAIEPALGLSLVTTDEPARIDARLRARGELRLAPGFTLQGAVSQNLYNTFEDAEAGSPALPPVRSDLIAFRRDSPTTVESVTGEVITKLSPALYGRVTAGYLETMYGGVSGEVLWKPATSSVGLGAEVNWVTARETDGLFGFRELDGLAEVNGHLSLYWDTGFQGYEAQIDVGRYLAGDDGATVTLSRRFNNGWEVGGFFTLTDVSEEDFGPGSFDRGVRITVPLAWGRAEQNRSRFTSSFGSAFNDGGARLEVPRRLYPLVRDVSRARLAETAGRFWK